MSKEQKYILTEETKTVFGHTLHRIQAVRDFNDVKRGDLGGFIETEHNLSNEGNAWVYDNANAYGNAIVYGNAKVYGNAAVYGDAMIYGNARVHGYAQVYGNAKVCGNAIVFGNVQVYGSAAVFESAVVYGNAKVYGNAMVHGDAVVSGNAEVYGNAKVCGNAKVSSSKDYIVFKNWWSSYRYFTWTRSNDMWRVGCFYGTGEELIAKAYKDSEESGREYKHVVEYVETIKKSI